jgi:hypothetical protein
MTGLSPEELRNRVAEGQIRAISIDTNVFTRSGYRLDAGLLKHIRQFADAGITFVLSDVVERELRRHKLYGLSEITQNLERSVEKAKKVGLIDSVAAAAARASCAAPESIVDSELEKFKRDTSTVIAPSNEMVDVGRLLDTYFGVLPPFEEKSDKKHEFPDAIALLSLEKWAEQNRVQMLVVSEDKGWLLFANRSPSLHAVKKLADAFDAFSEPVKNSQVISAIENSLISVDREAIAAALADQAADLISYLDADSYFHVELELHGVSLSEVDFEGIDREAFRQVELSTEENGLSELSLQITVPVKLDIDASASFSVYDSIDRDYTTLANDDLSFVRELEVEVLLSYSVERKADRFKIELRETELLSRPEVIHLGELEPDFGPPDEY